jgi:hypothetical protein
VVPEQAAGCAAHVAPAPYGRATVHMGGASGLYAGKGDEAEATDALKVLVRRIPPERVMRVERELDERVSTEKHEGMDVCAP